MQIQTTLTLFGASAVIATTIIAACRPVLTKALDAMCDARLSRGRVVFIACWAFAVVATILGVVSTAAVVLHSTNGAAPTESVMPLDRDGPAAVPDISTVPAIPDRSDIASSKIASGYW